jgi:hypothetical protein
VRLVRKWRLIRRTVEASAVRRGVGADLFEIAPTGSSGSQFLQCESGGKTAALQRG